MRRLIQLRFHWWAFDGSHCWQVAVLPHATIFGFDRAVMIGFGWLIWEVCIWFNAERGVI